MTSLNAPRILVVDDDPDICRNLSDILTDLGYQVDYAHDGLAALELVRHRPYDVALLDLKMPGMDGLTLYREIKKQRAGTVSLLVTAYASPATAQEALAAGAWKVVSKPVDFRELLGLVDEALGQPLVLIVDDDHDLCANLWDLFREQGFRVCLAHDAREAAEPAPGDDVQGRPDRHADPRGRWQHGVPDGPGGEPAGPHHPDHGPPLRDGPTDRPDDRRGGRCGLLQAVSRPRAAREAGEIGRASQEGAGHGRR